MRTKGSRPNRIVSFICGRCGVSFSGSNCYTKFCKPCRPIRKKEVSLAYGAKENNKKRANLLMRERRKSLEYRLKQNLWNKKWATNNIEKVRDIKRVAQNNRGKKIVGFVSLSEWRTIKKKFLFTCISCKRREPEIKLSIDHVVPISRGGLNVKDNIQPLCRSCNSKKQTKIIDYRLLYGRS